MFIGAYFSNNINLYHIIMLILSLTNTLIPIFPDYINRLLFYDIRIRKGEKFLIKISLFPDIIWIFVLILIRLHFI